MHADLFIHQYQLASQNAAPVVFRCMVVYDEQANGAIFNFANVVQSYDLSGATTNYALSQLNPDYKDRF